MSGRRGKNGEKIKVGPNYFHMGGMWGEEKNKKQTVIVETARRKIEKALPTREKGKAGQ